MKPVKIFSLKKHQGEYDSWPLETELLKEGIPTGRLIPGYVIEAQFKCGENYLLVTSWDCPFEEAQEFLLLSNDLKILSKKHLGAAYASVWIDGYEQINDREVIFHCGKKLDVLIMIRYKRPFCIGSFLRMRLIHK